MSWKNVVTWILPAVFLILFSLFEVLGLFTSAEHAVYDTWLHLKPEVPQREEILYVDVDDLAIARVGVWPWSREVMARGLITLREFQSGQVAFDIEYVDASPLAVDGAMLENQLPLAFDREFTSISGNVSSLIAAVSSGQIPLEDAAEYIGDLEMLTEDVRTRLLDDVREVVQNNDILLGNAAAAHGNAWFTVNVIPDDPGEAPRDRVDFAIQHAALKEVEGSNSQVIQAEGLRPAITPILSGGRGAGFPNVVIDEDGVRRRIELLRQFEGHSFGQFAFTPLLDWLGNPAIELSETRIVLKGAVLPGEEEPRDIRIPLAEDGSFLINWPPGDFIDQFRHISFYELVYYEQLLEDLIFNLTIMEESGYLEYHQGDLNFLRAAEYGEALVEDALTTGDPELLAELNEVRTYVIEEAGAFLDGPAEEQITGDLEYFLGQPDLPEDFAAAYEQALTDLPGVFESTRTIYSNLTETREILAENVPDSFVIVGYTGTGTTDVGVNPFEEEYANTGTHGAIVNTILTGLFLDDMPVWISIVVAFAFTVIFVVISRARSATTVLALGFAGAFVVVAGSALGLVFARVYFPILAPVLTILLSAVAQSAMKYIEVAREKNYIRHAFNHYLSADVINEIMDDPSRLQLGGEKRVLTAMFTDVRGFSSISETLDPEDLVKLLNRYLSEMSDIVLQLRGTIDKYEGDAIISFFGAPIPFEDHPIRACQAAIRMKKIERYLNDHFLEEKLSPSPLATRIGINTGEMVVGNMGTANRMDYTIMGHSVNLAARLEGVNKQYGTWILSSELTHRETGNTLLSRQLDRVRVVGVSEPVRLFEVLDEAELADDGAKQMVAEFHDGLDLFEHREWGEAGGVFSRLAREFPDDGPSSTFLERCEKFQKEPPPAEWDGVYNLTRK